MSAGLATFLPISLLGLVALGLPYLIVPRQTRSHRRLSLGIALTALVLVLLGPVLYALFDTRDLYSADSLAAYALIARLVFVDSLGAALLWLPLLALVWFGKAQRIESLRGQDLARQDR